MSKPNIGLNQVDLLDINGPKLGYSIRLNAFPLESVYWQDEVIISEFLEEPYGLTESK